jgi:hypothetical protein
LPQMNSEIKGKMVIPLFICIYITLHFQESSWTNFFHSPPCRLDWVGWLFSFTKWVASNFKKVT